ncbi:hypothetical protein [uncultured Paraglaciecola sp.]|uniref:hypothetical protein n=1 Tax=uncultured Paraglaciecola sp. TaxID=1765024 RepID=UPI002610BB86|nr:hypothetical protein [uncultured Paraglaciecola sp.]
MRPENYGRKTYSKAWLKRLTLFALTIAMAQFTQAQEILKDCDAETLTCDVTVLLSWEHVTTKTDGTAFDYTTELRAYQIEVATELNPFGDDCSNGCIETTSDTTTASLPWVVTEADVADNGETLAGFRVRAEANYGKTGDWLTETRRLVFPAEFINALKAAPSAVLNFTITVQ